MKIDDRAKRLGDIARLMLDMQLAELKRASRARQESLDRLQALEAPAAADLDPIAAAQAGLRYQAWADVRRASINLTLARQTAEWTTKRASAQHAFARSEALRLLSKRFE